MSVSLERGEVVSEKARLQLGEALFTLLQLRTLPRPQLSAEGPSLTTVTASLPSGAPLPLPCSLTTPSSQLSPGRPAPVLCSVYCCPHSLEGRPGSLPTGAASPAGEDVPVLHRALDLSVLPGVCLQVGSPGSVPSEGVQESLDPWDWRWCTNRPTPSSGRTGVP